MDLTETAVREWVKHAPIARTDARASPPPSAKSWSGCAKRNPELWTERDILNEAAAFLAKHQA